MKLLEGQLIYNIQKYTYPILILNHIPISPLGHESFQCQKDMNTALKLSLFWDPNVFVRVLC